MKSEIMVGKGTATELETLHGRVSKVYNKALNSLCEQIDYSDSQIRAYEESIRKAEEQGEDIEDIMKPRKYVIDKDDLALLKNAQSFLKENDIQVDVGKGSIGGKKLRRNIAEQIAEKMKYN